MSICTVISVHCWSISIQEHYCFTIRDREISSLPEELGALVGLPCFRLPCLPNISDYFYRDYERYLGLDSHALRKIVHGREIDLIALADHFKTVEPSRMVFRDRAVLICLLGRFLFVNNNPVVGHASLVTIAEQFEKGRTPIPLCVGELFVSLDRVKGDPHSPFTGCPCLLQVNLYPFRKFQYLESFYF